MERDEFPVWADSLGIPLMVVPFQFIALLLWSLLFLLFVKEVKALTISFQIILKVKFIFLFISIITLILFLITLFYGQYWYCIPALFWLYYYLSIGVNYNHFKEAFK